MLTIGIITFVVWVIWREAKRRQALPPTDSDIEKMW